MIAKIKEVFSVDLNEDAPAAAPAPAVEEVLAKKPRTRMKNEATAEAAPIPAVEEKPEEAPAKPKRGRKKKEAAAEAAPAPAPAVEEKVEKPAKRSRKKNTASVPATEEKVEEKAAKKPRGRKKKEQPVDESLLQMQSDAEAAVHALFNEKGTVIIQSPMGGEITPEEVLAKVGPVDKVYIRVDQNTAYWVRGDESGAVNLW